MEEAQLKLSITQGDISGLEQSIRAAERQLRHSRKFGTGLEAKCIAVAKARGTLVLEAYSVARAAAHARAAWAAHYKRFEDPLTVLKYKQSSCRIENMHKRLALDKLQWGVNDASALFAPLLEKTLRISAKSPNTFCSDGENLEKNGHFSLRIAGAARGAAHVLLMALGDLERYRATYSDCGSDSTAEALYLRALRARSSSGRAPGMLATIASSRGDSSAAVVHGASTRILLNWLCTGTLGMALCGCI